VNTFNPILLMADGTPGSGLALKRASRDPPLAPSDHSVLVLIQLPQIPKNCLTIELKEINDDWIAPL
jgi:hypothetical protein